MRRDLVSWRWAWPAALAAVSLPALADDKAAAEILFDEGKKLLAEGKFDQACPKLAESHRLDPGVGTLLYLAECHERAGKLASAWATFREAMALALQTNQPQRARVAREHAESLLPRLIRVQIEVPAESELPGLSITRNGVAVARPLWGSPVPVDPGPIEVVASAPGRVAWKTTHQKPAAGLLVLRVPPLEIDRPPAPLPGASGAASAAPVPTASAAPAPTASAAPAAPAASAASSSAPTAEPRGSPRRTAALVVGGLGLAGVGLGSFFGIKTISTWKDARSHCTEGVCDGEARRLSKEAVSSSTLSTVFFAVGVAGLGVGVGLWLTAPPEQVVRVSPVVGPGVAGLSLSGRL